MSTIKRELDDFIANQQKWYAIFKTHEDGFLPKELERWQTFEVEGDNGRKCMTGLMTQEEIDTVAIEAANQKNADTCEPYPKDQWAKAVKKYLESPSCYLPDDKGSMLVVLLVMLNDKSRPIHTLYQAGVAPPDDED